MKYGKYLGALILLLISGMIGCTPTPAALPLSSTDAPADTAVPAPPENDSPWEVIVEANVEQPVRMAAFLDEQVGFTGGAGAAGTAQYTTDGGQTWTPSEAGGG
jgi:hypothetical protein